MKLQMAQQYQRAGNKQQALNLIKDVLAEDPNDVEALFALANLQLSVQKKAAAKPLLEQIIDLEPTHFEGHLRLANILHHEGNLKEMLVILSKAEDLSDDYMSLFKVGKVYQGAGFLDLAEQCYLKALTLPNTPPQVFSALGAVSRDKGELEIAKEYFRKAIAVNPDSGSDHLALANLSKPTGVTDEVRLMELRYQGGDKLVAKQKMFFAYGLGKAYEDIGSYDKSFDYMLEANRLEGEQDPYSREQTRNSFSNIKGVFTEKFFHYHAGMGSDTEVPIFIVGMPRSGTSLTEQILASHPDIHGAGELDDMRSLSFLIPNITGKPFPLDINIFTKAQYGQMANRYLDKLKALSSGEQRVTDKMPTNFLYIGLINLLFPRAKIIHCSRNPMDNCLSMFRNTFTGSFPYSHDLENLGDYYLQYVDLMSHWHQVLPYKIYDVVYEDLVANTEEEIRAMLNFCDLPFDEACLNFHHTKRQVATASAGQVRSPISAKSIEGWKRFEQQLQPLAEILDMQEQAV